VEEEVYVYQPLGFEDPNHPKKVYKVVKAIYGLHQAPRAWYETLANYLLGNGFHRGKIDHTLFIKWQKGDILLVRVYVDGIIFGSTKKELYVKSTSTPVDMEKTLVKDTNGDDVDVHLYRSMIGSLMYLTASRPDIMYAEVYNYGLSDPKKQIDIMAVQEANCGSTSTTEADYVATASCCRQVLWIQNQMLDYRFKIDKRKRFKLTLEVFRYIFKIYPRVQGQDFDVLPTDEEIVSFLRDLSHTEEIHSLNDVIVDQMHQPCRTFAALINRSLSRNITVTPPKKARKFKKPASPKLINVLVSTEEPTGKSKRVKRHAKKSTQALSRGVIIRETPEIPMSKKKEKVDVARGKGIELLSDVALTEEAQYEEVRKKSLRDIYKTHPSGSGTATKPTPSTAIIKPFVINEGTDDNNNDQDFESDRIDQEKAGDDDKTQSDNENESNSKHETNESSFKSDQEEDEEKIEDDKEEEEEEIVKTPSSDFEDEDETKVADKEEGDEYKEMDYTTSLLYDDILQVIEDAHVTLSIVPQKTKVLVTSSSHSSVLETKFLNFADIPHSDAEIVSPLDVHVHHEVLIFQFKNRVTTLKKEVVELKKDDPLLTQVTALVDEHLDTRLGATRDEFMNFLLKSLTARIIKQVKNQLPQILPEEVSTFASLRKTSKDAEPPKGPKAKESHSSSSKGDRSKSKSFGKSVQSKEPEFEVTNSDMPHDQKENPCNDDEEPKEKLASNVTGLPNLHNLKNLLIVIGMLARLHNKDKIKAGPAFRLLKGTRSNYAELEYDFEECYKALLEKLDWENPEGSDYPFNLTKPYL
nr:hypothetical protein [Tanacetum cinerariifolium]